MRLLFAGGRRSISGNRSLWNAEEGTEINHERLTVTPFPRLNAFGDLNACRKYVSICHTILSLDGSAH